MNEKILENNMNNEYSNVPYMVGNQVIYDEQRSVAHTIMGKILDGDTTVVTVSQPQGGKTGVIISVCDQFCEDCENRKLDYMIIFVLALSDLSLKKQNRDRFNGSGLTEIGIDIDSPRLKFFDFHAPDVYVKKGYYQKVLTKFRKNPNTKLLIILDEAHIGQVLEGRLSKMYNDFGIEFGKPKSEWKNKNVNLLAVTATDFAFKATTALLNEYNKENGFSFTLLKPNKSYYSLSDLLGSGRVEYSENIIDKKNVSKWFIDRVKEYLTACKNDNGYMVLRISKEENVEIIRKYIKNNYLQQIETITFDCKNKNIEDLSFVFQHRPVVPKIIIIKNTLRMGKTISTTKFIRMWIDTKTDSRGNCDAIIQSIGRNLGYKTEFDLNDPDKHDKFKDTYKIYCNKNELKICNDLYIDQNSIMIPSGVQNGTSKIVAPNNNHILILNGKNKEMIDKELIPILNNILPKTKGFIEANIKNSNVYTTLNTVSKNDSESNNWCEKIFKFQSKAINSDIPDSEKGVRILLIDQISPELRKKDNSLYLEFNRSRKKLMTSYPELDNAFVYIMCDDEYNIFKNHPKFNKYKIISQLKRNDIINTLKPKCILQKAL